MTPEPPTDDVAASPPAARGVPPELILAAVAASFSAPFIRWADAPPLVTGSARTLLALLIALPAAIRVLRAEGARQARSEAPARNWALFGLSRQDLVWVGVAAVALALHFATWITGLDETSVASATVLVNAHPLIVLGAEAFFFGRVVRRREWGGAGLALLGVLVLAGGDLGLHGPRALQGDALSFLGAVTTAVYVLAGSRVRQRLPNAVYVACLYAVCAVLLGLGSLVFREPWPSPLHPVPAWAGFLALAVVPTSLGHSLVNRVLGYVRAGFVSVALLAEPVLAPLWAFLWFHQVPTWPEAAGGLLTILGMVLVLWPSRPEAAPPVRSGPAPVPDPLPD